MEYKEEKLAGIQGEIIPLLYAHKDEVSKFDAALDPDWDTYFKLEDMGILKIFTARYQNRLVGYYIVMIWRHLHYNFKVADNDVVYMDPEFRDFAKPFFRFVRTKLEYLADYETMSIKDTVDFRGFAESQGFRFLEYKYFRRLK